MNPHQIKIKWHGQYITWHSLDLEPDDGSPGFVIICTNNGHWIAETQLEIYEHGKLIWNSPDVWFPGMVKTYG